MNPKANIETSHGTIVVELWSDKAPRHVENFSKLAGDGFYDDLIFHRVIPGFMVQTGCPQGTGTGGPGWNVDAEFNDADFVKGTLGMARSSDPNSAGSQFFIMVDHSAHLNGQYTAFGTVLSGQDVADAIAGVARDGSDRPREDVKMAKVTIEQGEG
ncbi:MAG: peptidylprolyl isomerase [Planctomycetes bacterium]|nr:peptidylprolyl isomerase [Planctomycetota bacterium]